MEFKVGDRVTITGEFFNNPDNECRYENCPICGGPGGVYGKSGVVTMLDEDNWAQYRVKLDGSDIELSAIVGELTAEEATDD